MWWAANALFMLMIACHAWLAIIVIRASGDAGTDAADLRLPVLLGFLLNADVAAARSRAEATVDRLFPAAEAGDAAAQYEIARALLWNPGAIGRACEGLRWLDRSARGGHPPAQIDLARAYAGGFGVGRDDTLAYGWALTASQGGPPGAADYLSRYGDRLDGQRRAAIEQDLPKHPLQQQAPAHIFALPEFEILLWFSRLYLRAEACAALPAP